MDCYAKAAAKAVASHTKITKAFRPIGWWVTPKGNVSLPIDKAEEFLETAPEGQKKSIILWRTQEDMINNPLPKNYN